MKYENKVLHKVSWHSACHRVRFHAVLQLDQRRALYQKPPKAASDSLGFFSDYSYTDALIEDAIDSLDDTLDDLRDSAENLEYYYDIPANKARSVAKKATRILKTIKDFALSPRDAALICADASSILRTAVKYEMISESTTDSDEYKRGKTIMFVISLMFWAALLLGIAALTMRVLGRSQNLDIAYFAVMILLALAAIIVTIWANGKLEDSVLRLTLWPFLGVLCAVPMKLLPNIKASAYTPARANTRAYARPSAPALTCASCGSRLDPSERFLLPLRRTRCTGKTGCSRHDLPDLRRGR